jgi:hypothetical protein
LKPAASNKQICRQRTATVRCFFAPSSQDCIKAVQHPCTEFHYYSLFQQFFAEIRYLFANVNRKNLVAHRTAGDYTNNRNRGQKKKTAYSTQIEGTHQ